MRDAYLNRMLGENEHIVLVTRQHWMVVFGEILIEGILAIAIVILIALIQFLLPGNPWVLVGYLLLLLPLISMLRDIVIWDSRKYIVTSRRVIQLSGVFSKNVTDSSLEKVNDVKMNQSFLGRLFDYGDVEILTASELGVNKFTKIGRPVRFKTAMLNAKERLEQEQAGGARVEADVPSLIAQLDSLRRQGVLSEEEFQRKKADLLAKL
jgi:uncharacterized membrane protein YdbT with pleckstrin-like domain